MLTIREARLLAGLTQAELARRAGTSRTALAAIESGARTASPELCRRLLTATGIRPSMILAARRDQVIAILDRYHVSELRLTGSAARGADGPDSDIDLVVHLPEHFSGLQLVELADELEGALGIPVDVISDRATGPVAEAILAHTIPA